MSKTRSVLLCSTATGAILHWHATSGKLLHRIQLIPENQALCLDYSTGAINFAVGCRDAVIRIYDEATKQISNVLEGSGDTDAVGHSNRIFAVKFYSTQLLLSGGWDNTIYLWDLRSN